MKTTIFPLPTEELPCLILTDRIAKQGGGRLRVGAERVATICQRSSTGESTEILPRKDAGSSPAVDANDSGCVESCHARKCGNSGVTTGYLDRAHGDWLKDLAPVGASDLVRHTAAYSQGTKRLRPLLKVSNSRVSVRPAVTFLNASGPAAQMRGVLTKANRFPSATPNKVSVPATTDRVAVSKAATTRDSRSARTSFM